MQIYAAGMTVLVLWLLLVWRSTDLGVALSILLLPFGMFAVATLPFGGLSPLAAHVTAALTCLLAIFLAMGGRGVVIPPLPSAALPLLLLGLYAVFSATILVQFFAGKVYVFSFERAADGFRVDPLFRARLSELKHSSGNVSQTGYLLLSIAFFLLVSDIARRRGVDFLIKMLRWAAIINIVLGIIDYSGLEFLLAPVRTANYRLLNEASIEGIPRAIGAFSEASSFGGFSAALAGFMLTYGHVRRNRRDFVIGAGCAGFAVMSLSTTAFIGLAAVALFFLARALKPFFMSIDKHEAYFIISGLTLTLSFFTLILLSNVLGELPGQVFDKLIFSKRDSLSGLERGAMTMQGWRIFVETGGLGAGVGSGRANGLVPALLAAMGLPGLLLFVWFLKRAVLDGRAEWDMNLKAARRAAQCSIFASLSVSMASSFMVDPGLLVMTLSAMTVAARDRDWEKGFATT